DPLTDLVAGKPRQPAIEDHEVRRFLSVPPQGSLTVVCGDDLVALVTEKRRDHSDERALVVHDEDAGQRDAVSAVARARGKVNEAGDDLCGAPLITAHEDRLTRARARELVPARHRRDLLQSGRYGRAQVEAGPP